MQQQHPALLTFDVEDWEHANFPQLEGREAQVAATRAGREYAMDANTDRWIELLAARRAKSTCFVLGEFASRYPGAVKRLASAGHEIATHGATHDLVYRMSREGFREFLARGIGGVGELVGSAPIGFRAPSWSVDPRATPWLCEELARQGIRYDSSIFPVRAPLIGRSAGASLSETTEAGVLRVPVTVLTVAGFRLPFSSGAFFRLAPLPVIRRGLQRARAKGLPAMVVLHPRELDPGHPRLPLTGWERGVHYARLSSTVPKLERLLAEIPFTSLRERYFSGSIRG